MENFRISVPIIRYVIKYTFIICMLSLLSSCQKPPLAKEQYQGKVNLPEYPNFDGKPFFFSTENFSRLYFGQLLVWDPEIEQHIDLVQQMISLAYKHNKTYTEKILYKEQQIKPLEEEIIRLEENKNSLQAEKSSKQRALMEHAAQNWFDSKIIQIEPKLSDSDITTLHTMFGDFCEAKIWEYLLKKRLIENTYTRRPTPFAMCEGYYQKNQFFSENESACSPSNDTTGKNYTWCFWVEGVLKTRSFNNYNETKKAKLLQISFNDIAAFSNRPVTLGYLKLVNRSGLIKGTENYFDFKADPNDPLIPSNIISSFKNPFPSTPDRYSQSLSLTDEGKNRILGENILQNIWVFADLGAADNTTDVGVSDFIFNNQPISTIILKTNEVTLDEVKSKFVEIFNAPDPELDPKISETETQINDEKKDLSVRELIYGENANCDTDSENESDKNSLTCKVKNLVDERTLVANTQHVASALLANVELSLEQFDSESFKISLKFAPGTEINPVVGCFNVFKKSQVGCPTSSKTTQETATDSFLPTKFLMDDTTGKISLSFMPIDPKSLGLAFLDKQEDQKENSVNFVLIDTETTRKSVIEVELFPTQWGHFINVLTGNFFIRDQNTAKKLYSGNFELKDM